MTITEESCGSSAATLSLRAGRRGRYPENPPSSKNRCSSSRIGRPRIGLRCGKRPKRRMMSWWPRACFSVLPERAVQPHRALLVGEVFGVPERQVEEASELRLDRQVVSGDDRGAGDRARGASVAYMRGVPRKALRGNWSRRRISANAPVGVASQPKSSPRAAAWCRSEEARAKFLVEGGVLLEPAFSPRLAPEGDDSLGGPRGARDYAGQGCVHEKCSVARRPLQTGGILPRCFGNVSQMSGRGFRLTSMKRVSALPPPCGEGWGGVSPPHSTFDAPHPTLSPQGGRGSRRSLHGVQLTCPTPPLYSVHKRDGPVQI